ncbi:flavin prenyltransferase UbiX [Wenzhouxiangella sp. XN24]|uniref:flavin prenyltransferase UbiX n=1 Tax=Wenzhouxiangella sp. XN24 TaxID=2713569 RepID=UPI0013EC8A39|nr:flavin prenyltransferase UbiX [Wenzhouxiangella sp. XN24]NGX15169.1 UbiX family flavin prenyltransferase [Wenzhouxiangella sp. XN24]
MSLHVALAMTGASGAQYGLRLLECLLGADCRVSLMISKPAQVVIGMETDLGLPSRPAEIRRFFCQLHDVPESRLAVHGQEEWTAPVASGSAAPDAMVVCPCTTATVSALATGASRSLIERAGDVVLKERRPLVLVVRETPFSPIHLENMLTLARAGAVILPANPGFYHRPAAVSELVDFVVARVLDHLGIPQELMAPWGAQ